MKIAHVSMFYYPTYGGVEKVMQELAERQVKDGHEVHVFCCDSDKYKRIKSKYEIVNGVHVHRHRYWFRLSLSTFIWPGLLFNKILKKGDFDIIHSHVSGHAYVLFAGMIAKKLKIPHIHTTHCPWTDKHRPLRVRIPLFFTYLLFNKLAFKRCTKVIAITPWEIETLKKWVPEEKIQVIPNGMDNIYTIKIKDNKFKQRLGIEKNKLVLFFSRLNITKGPDKFVLAAKEILKDNPEVRFVIRGPDEGMKRTVKNLIGSEKRIILMEPTHEKKEIAEMYQAADVYVLPSYREGLPLTLFEAMASGLPIVASPVQGIPYEMSEPENGFFVKYGNINGLKENILKVINNKSLSEKISKNNIQKSKNYTWDSIYKRYMGAYNKISK